MERRRKENVIDELGKCIKAKRFTVRSNIGIEKVCLMRVQSLQSSHAGEEGIKCLVGQVN